MNSDKKNLNSLLQYMSDDWWSLYRTVPPNNLSKLFKVLVAKAPAYVKWHLCGTHTSET